MKFKSEQTFDKLRGGYYSPIELAEYITKWLLKDHPKSILEPSCGDGVFIDAIAQVSKSKKEKLTLIEVIDSEYNKSIQKAQKYGFETNLCLNSDFLAWSNQAMLSQHIKFDAAFGNPPFIRYQFLEKEFQEQAEKLFKNLDLKFTKHTNSWTSFVLASIALLKDGGKFGMIIPAEIITVSHAKPLREFLESTCSRILIINPKEIWFENTLQGAVILFAQKKSDVSDETDGIAIHAVQGTDFLNHDPDEIYEQAFKISAKNAHGKWTKGLLSEKEIKLLEKFTKHKNVHKFTDIATVDVGIVTGANDFFLINDETVNQYGLHNYVSPMFGRSQHCKGVIYDEAQHSSNKLQGLGTNFLYLKDEFDTLPKPVQEYIKFGESQELHTRYKCRIRKPWYKVPSVYSTELGMLKRSHEYPRLIFNEIQAYTTDTAYRIKLLNELDPRLVTYCFINPLTAIYAELSGRSYGGGVLELVPSEIENLYIPMPLGLEFNLNNLNESFINLDMETILQKQGEIIFTKLGFKTTDINNLFKIWQKLRDKRQRNE